MSQRITTAKAIKPVIIAIGEREGLGPLNTSCPTTLLPIVTRPLLHYQIELLKASGFDDAIIIVSHRDVELYEQCIRARNEETVDDFKIDIFPTGAIDSGDLIRALTSTDNEIINDDGDYDDEDGRDYDDDNDDNNTTSSNKNKNRSKSPHNSQQSKKSHFSSLPDDNSEVDDMHSDTDPEDDTVFFSSQQNTNPSMQHDHITRVKKSIKDQSLLIIPGDIVIGEPLKMFIAAYEASNSAMNMLIFDPITRPKVDKSDKKAVAAAALIPDIDYGDAMHIGISSKDGRIVYLNPQPTHHEPGQRDESLPPVLINTILYKDILRQVSNFTILNQVRSTYIYLLNPLAIAILHQSPGIFSLTTLMQYLSAAQWCATNPRLIPHANTLLHSLTPYPPTQTQQHQMTQEQQQQQSQGQQQQEQQQPQQQQQSVQQPQLQPPPALHENTTHDSTAGSVFLPSSTYHTTIDVNSTVFTCHAMLLPRHTPVWRMTSEVNYREINKSYHHDTTTLFSKWLQYYNNPQNALNVSRDMLFTRIKGMLNQHSTNPLVLEAMQKSQQLHALASDPTAAVAVAGTTEPESAAAAAVAGGGKKGKAAGGKKGKGGAVPVVKGPCFPGTNLEIPAFDAHGNPILHEPDFTADRSFISPKVVFSFEPGQPIIIRNSIIGAHVRISSNVTINNSIIHDHAVICSGARLNNTVVCQHFDVQNNVQVTNSTLATGSNIPPGATMIDGVLQTDK